MKFIHALLKVFSWASVVFGFFMVLSLEDVRRMPNPEVWIMAVIISVFLGLVGCAYLVSIRDGGKQ